MKERGTGKGMTGATGSAGTHRQSLPPAPALPIIFLSLSGNNGNRKTGNYNSVTQIDLTTNYESEGVEKRNGGKWPRVRRWATSVDGQGVPKARLFRCVPQVPAGPSYFYIPWKCVSPGFISTLKLSPLFPCILFIPYDSLHFFFLFLSPETFSVSWRLLAKFYFLSFYPYLLFFTLVLTIFLSVGQSLCYFISSYHNLFVLSASTLFLFVRFISY